jgi:hypothetical protein
MIADKNTANKKVGSRPLGHATETSTKYSINGARFKCKPQGRALLRHHRGRPFEPAANAALSARGGYFRIRYL